MVIAHDLEAKRQVETMQLHNRQLLGELRAAIGLNKSLTEKIVPLVMLHSNALMYGILFFLGKTHFQFNLHCTMFSLSCEHA